MAIEKTFFPEFKKKEIEQVFLGIDFGTSYTKVSYSIAPSDNPQIHTLEWNSDDKYFIQSVIYFKEDKLYFTKPEKDYEEIKYFKYSILEESLRNYSQKNLKNNFEEMCCVYYLAQIIKRSLKQIQEKNNIKDLENIKITVNMGAPLENFYNEREKPNKELYLEILENAITLAGGSAVKAGIPENDVSLLDLDSVYTELLKKKPKLKWRADVIPELAAELFLYHQSKSVPEGIYVIIDIGGGTVDMAVFQKYKYHPNAPAGMYCLAQKVIPLGVEILNTKKNEDDKLQSKRELQETFSRMVITSRRRMDGSYDDIKKVDVFFLGGGANNDWYKNSISETTVRLRSGFNPKLNFSYSIESFINSEDSLLIKNQRLIISQMISKTKDDITSVLGFPDYYEVAESEPRGIQRLSHNRHYLDEDAAKRSGWDDSSV